MRLSWITALGALTGRNTPTICVGISAVILPKTFLFGLMLLTRISDVAYNVVCPALRSKNPLLRYFSVFKNLAFLLWMDSEQLLGIVFYFPSLNCTSMQGLLVLASRSDVSSLCFPPLTSFPSGLVTPSVKNQILDSLSITLDLYTQRKREEHGREREQACLHSPCLGLFLPSLL